MPAGGRAGQRFQSGGLTFARQSGWRQHRRHSSPHPSARTPASRHLLAPRPICPPEL